MAERCGDRKHKVHSKQPAIERLKAELDAAFAVPDDAYVPLTADELIARHRERAG